MKYKPNLPEAAERMRRFWMLEEPLDRIPCTVSLPLPPWPVEGNDAAFHGKMDQYLEYKEKIFQVEVQVPDDRLPFVHPIYGHALISALCGSPIKWVAGTVWSTPIIDEWSKLDALRIDFDSEYGVKMRADYEMLLDWARGKCAVSRYEIEGVSDTMAALRGIQKALYDCYDSPEQFERFANKVVDILIQFTNWNFTNVTDKQDLCGGTASDYGLWHPDRSIQTTEDASVLMSPRVYCEFFKKHTARLLAAFPRSLMEVHPEGNHQIPEFGSIEGVGLMTIENPLHMKPRDREAVVALRGKKCFTFGCAMEEIEKALALMGTRGVYIGTGVATAAEAKQALTDIAKWTRNANRG